MKVFGMILVILFFGGLASFIVCQELFAIKKYLQSKGVA